MGMKIRMSRAQAPIRQPLAAETYAVYLAYTRGFWFPADMLTTREVDG
jgi:hypothetical protein